MAITVSLNHVSSIGDQYLSQFNIAFDNNYPAGGYPFSSNDIGLSKFENLFNVGNGGGFQYLYNLSTGKIQVLESVGPGGNTGDTSGGTPSGTVGAPALTMDPYAPTGTNGPSALSAGLAAGQVWTSGAYTPTGTNGASVATGTCDAQAFTGDLMVVHAHNAQVTQAEAVVVAAFATGALLVQPQVVQAVYSTAGGTTGPLVIIPNGQVPAMGQVAIDLATGFLTFNVGDTITAVSVTYTLFQGATTTAGTPTGTNAASALSAGSAAAQAFTGDMAILTGSNADSLVTGTCDAQMFTGDVAALTGSNSAPMFAGDLLGVHNHTIAAGAGGEVAPGTNLSAVTAAQFLAIGL